jgi:hypothetical protein
MKLLIFLLFGLSASAQVKKPDYKHNALVNWKIAKAHEDSAKMFKQSDTRYWVHKAKQRAYLSKSTWDVEKDYDDKLAATNKAKKP